MKFDKIQKQHITLALQDFKLKGLPVGFKASTYFDIEIDGGINFENSKTAIEAGANILVSGTTIFKSNNGDIKKNIDLLKSL